MLPRGFLILILALAVLSGSAGAEGILDDLQIAGAPEQDVKIYLPVSEAFRKEVSRDEQGRQAQIRLIPAPGYYLYRAKISAVTASGRNLDLDLPGGLEHTDDFMGTQVVYYVPVTITVPLEEDVTVTFQGCTEGMCYPPQRLIVAAPFPSDSSAPEKVAAAGSPETAAPAGPQARPEQHLREIPEETGGSLLGSARELALFLLVGLSLSFTPCVFPMYPILSMMLFGRKSQGQENRRTFAISLFFVLGIALTYAGLGVVTSYFGAQTHAFLQQKAVLITFSVIFIILSLSMLGLFTIQVPAFISSRLQKIADNQHAGSLTGAFVMGVTASLICSPCTTAPVSASVLYTIQKGSVITGTLDLLMLGIGMGLPMLAIGLFGRRVLPRAGNWLELIKRLIGIFSLCVPLILLDRILPSWILPAGIIVLCGTALMTVVHSVRPRLTLACLPAILALGLAAGWYLVDWNGTAPGRLEFRSASSLEQIQDLLDRSPGKKAVIDFYASWCTSCRRYEEETFASSAVQRELADYLLIRVDLSESDEQNGRISAHYNLVGLPSVMLTDENRNATLLSGFYDSKGFLKELRKQRR